MADEEIARFYTRSRQFPLMIGRMRDGSRIWGGPYTFSQVGFGGTALLVLTMTRTLWSTGSSLVDLTVIAGIGWGVAWLAGLIPITRRNLFSALTDLIAAMFKPYGGRHQGRSVRLTRPHRAIGATLIPTPAPQPTTGQRAAAPQIQAAPEPVGRAAGGTGLTRAPGTPAGRASARLSPRWGTPEKTPTPSAHTSISAVERLLHQANHLTH